MHSRDIGFCSPPTFATKTAMRKVYKHLMVGRPGELSLRSATAKSVVHLIMPDLSCKTYEVN